MINLATFTKRSEFIEAYLALDNKVTHLSDCVDEAEKERDYWREFAHDLEIKLQEHEGIIKPSNSEMENEFQKFWATYGRKGNLKKTKKRWFSLSDKKRALAMNKVTAYVKSTPEKCYRKNGEAWINQEGWNDEIVEATQPYGRPAPARVTPSRVEDRQEEAARLEEASKLRKASRGRNVRDILK